MPTAAQIKALIRSHADGDDQRFYSVALQVAAQAARQGHRRFAQELRDVINHGRSTVPQDRRKGPLTRPVPMVQPRGELAGLLTAAYPKARLTAMALAPDTHKRIERVLTEQRQRANLQAHGLWPQRRLLLVGLPGTGKTMTATVLAGELGLPLFGIQFHSLITKYLGETAAKLRLIFDAMKETRAVYLFDEFDALGADRASPNEVGEIRRVLNSFYSSLSTMNLIAWLSQQQTIRASSIVPSCDASMLSFGILCQVKAWHLGSSETALLCSRPLPSSGLLFKRRRKDSVMPSSLGLARTRQRRPSWRNEPASRPAK